MMVPPPPPFPRQKRLCNGVLLASIGMLTLIGIIIVNTERMLLSSCRYHNLEQTTAITNDGPDTDAITALNKTKVTTTAVMYPSSPISNAQQQAAAAAAAADASPFLTSEDQEVAHVVYENNLRYRRVCTTVYESILCMILRYPFPVPLQHPYLTYPSPVDERFYNLTTAIILDGDGLETCRRHHRHQQQNDNNNSEVVTNISQRVFYCLEHHAQQYNHTVVVALFTRQQQNSQQQSDDDDGIDFYGTTSPLQRKRLHDFYHDHDILLVGDSVAPFVAASIADLFQTCHSNETDADHHHHNNNHDELRLDGTDLYTAHHCDSPFLDESSPKPHDLSSSSSSSSSSILIRNLWFKPEGTSWNADWLSNIHSVNGTRSFIETFRNKTWLLRPGPITPSPHHQLRPLSIIVQYPLAWTQTHHMIVHLPELVQANQEAFINMLANITSLKVRQELKELGFELSHVIVLDGFPQHFPSETSAFFFAMYPTRRSISKGYREWHAELYGSTCRGPLPSTSALSRINRSNRKLWEQQQQYQHHYKLDMRYYAKAWEFANQFWWELVMWKRVSLDCTHPMTRQSGGPRVIKYFLQAIIDGHYESQQ